MNFSGIAGRQAVVSLSEPVIMKWFRLSVEINTFWLRESLRAVGNGWQLILMWKSSLISSLRKDIAFVKGRTWDARNFIEFHIT
jgi:hypothetical protein